MECCGEVSPTGQCQVYAIRDGAGLRNASRRWLVSGGGERS